MPNEVDHYGPHYRTAWSDLVAAIQAESYGEDYGQNGWQTADELEHLVEHMALGPRSALLDVACGTGGPAMRVAGRTGCSVTGIDLHEDAVGAARRAAEERGLADTARFEQADASQPLPFDSQSFDAVLCVDAINHLPERASVLAEFARVLEPGGRLAYIDPIVVTGWISDEEMRIRSSIGFFLFVPVGLNEALLAAAGFDVVAVEDRTENMATIAARRRAARERHADALRDVEGADGFEAQQAFFDVCSRLAAERRLSRFAFFATKSAS